MLFENAKRLTAKLSRDLTFAVMLHHVWTCEFRRVLTCFPDSLLPRLASRSLLSNIGNTVVSDINACLCKTPVEKSPFPIVAESRFMCVSEILLQRLLEHDACFQMA